MGFWMGSHYTYLSTPDVYWARWTSRHPLPKNFTLTIRGWHYLNRIGFESLRYLQGFTYYWELKGFCHFACSSVQVVEECRVSLRRL